MATREVVLYPDNPLTLKAQPVQAHGPEMSKLATEMVEIMEAYDGVGLAAPQIGIAKRIVVIREPGSPEPLCLINPEVLEKEGSETGEEGCLSLPYIYAEVPRATRIVVRAQNELGKEITFQANGFLARIIQHEVDHLDGILFIDRLDVLTREAKLREWKDVRDDLSSAPGGSA